MKKPFRTIERARKAVGELKIEGQLSKPATVMIRGGTYYLSEPVIFTASDSGTEKCPITYMAYPGEKPVISGGKKITDWKRYEGEIMQSFLPEVKRGKRDFRQLFFNGQTQICARYPDRDLENPLYGGCLFIAEAIDKRAFQYEPGTFPRRWAKPAEGRVFIWPWKCWNNDIIPIKDIDYKNRIITLDRPVIHRLNQADGSLDFMSLLAGNRFYLENLLEELDQPGEWCLDKEAGILYFWPPEKSLDGCEVTIPTVSRLIEFRGSTGVCVKYIKLSGLTFTQTLSVFPQPDILPHNYPNSGGHAVYLEGAENCVIEKCSFDSVGGDAIRLQNYNAENQIIENEIAYAGAHGICIAGVEQELPAWACWKNQELFTKLSSERPKSVRNKISDNIIHHCGTINKRGSGVYIYGINCVDNVISHNLIHNTAHRGIMIVHGFGRNIIEYNHLYDLGLEASDTGGINTLLWYVVESDKQLCNGNIIRYNLVRNVVGCGAYGKPQEPVGRALMGGKLWTPYYGWGIYLDWNAVGTTVYGNIVIGNTLGGFMMLGQVKNITVENNIFVNSTKSQLYYWAIFGDAEDNRFVRNIVYYTNPDALLIRLGRYPDKKIFTEFDYNVFYAGPNRKPVIDLPDIPAEKSFDKWRQLGYDSHSIVADPLFVDPANHNYNLKPNSPAFKLGFKPIDMSTVGPRPRKK